MKINQKGSSTLTSFFSSLIFSLLFSVITVYGLVHYFPQFLPNNNSELTTTTQQPKNEITLSHSEDELITKLVEDKRKAVVSIVISKEIQNLRQRSLFDELFLNPFGEMSPQEEAPQEPPRLQKIGGGSGFLVDSKGVVLTNKHVVSDPKAEYTVVMDDGSEYKAEVKALDPFFDLAILQIINAKTSFPTLKLGNSAQIKPGQTVLAIGNALAEFSGTVTKGIVSGLNRTTSASANGGQTETLSNVIQVDVPINPGNSGGPLINLQGEVIGINTAVANANSIGFVLPINDAKQAIDSYAKFGKIIRPRLGLRYVVINEEIQKANQLKYDYGALVIRGDRLSDLAVIPGGPADKAGIVENDIILEINGKKIDEQNSLVNRIQEFKIGDTVKAKVFHNDTEKEVLIKLEELETKN